MWDSSGGTAYGRVDAIATDSSLESSLRDEPMEASEDNPAIRIELVDRVDGEIEGRGETVLHRPGTLSMASEDDVKAAPSPERKSAVGEERRLTFEAKRLEIKQDDESDEFKFEGYGAVFGNKDRGGDIIQSGAFKRTIQANDGTFPLLADHDMSLSSRLGVVKVQEDSHGVKVDGFINTDTQAGREAASHIRHAKQHGENLGMSFGYQVQKDEFSDEKNARILKELQAYEFSLTQLPMNPKAGVTGIKQFLDDESALQKLARELAPLLANDDRLISAVKQELGEEPATDSGDNADSVAELKRELNSLTETLTTDGT
jgi:hypothetical protein